MLGLKMPLASVYRGERVRPAAKRSLKFGSRPFAVDQGNAGERAFDPTKTCRRIDDAGRLKRFP
jgi:hypothetical protein